MLRAQGPHRPIEIHNRSVVSGRRHDRQTVINLGQIYSHALPALAPNGVNVKIMQN